MEIITENTTDMMQDTIAYLADEDTVVVSDVGHIVHRLRPRVEMASP